MRKLKNNDDVSSLSHTKWNCQYHIVFTPKYRRKAIFNKLRADIGRYLRRSCEYQGVEIVEAHACSDHIHMLVKIPPKLSVSKFMGYLKGKSSLMIFDEHANLKYNYGNRHFWAEGYYVSTVGLNKNTIKKYIQEQEDEVGVDFYLFVVFGRNIINFVLNVDKRVPLCYHYNRMR